VLRSTYAYTIILYNTQSHTFYKIPTGVHPTQNSRVNTITDTTNFNLTKLVHVCIDTYYSSVLTDIYSTVKQTKLQTAAKFMTYKPIYFERFKYLGKGFKLLLKKKRHMFNCIFGYSHIYWIKLQSLKVKRTKKYKYVFVAPNYQTFLKTIAIIKKIKPINRYTLRGVRSYTHVWIKRKGRKSVSTHM